MLEYIRILNLKLHSIYFKMNIFSRLTASLYSNPQFSTTQETCHPSHGASYPPSSGRCTPMGAGWSFLVLVWKSNLIVPRVPVQDYFLNTAYEGIGRSKATFFSKELVQNFSEFENCLICCNYKTLHFSISMGAWHT